MAKDGFPSAATIKTLPGNYQAWVILSDKPGAETRRIASQGLEKHYGGDINSADNKHYGRLAGFTNQKPQHTRNGRQPYMLAHDCHGKASTAPPAHLGRIEHGVAQKERQKRLGALEGCKSPDYCDQADLSPMDWMIAQDMAKSDLFTMQDIKNGI